MPHLAPGLNPERLRQRAIIHFDLAVPRLGVAARRVADDRPPSGPEGGGQIVGELDVDGLWELEGLDELRPNPNALPPVQPRLSR
jgi:hypothetical protein